MSVLEDSREKAVPTIVCFHDLLGYGELLATSGGTLDSAVGEIAYKRILGLQRSVAEVSTEFPDDTMFFHFNDTVTAYLDVDIQIGSPHTDPSSISGSPIPRAKFLKILHFLGGCAKLHQRSIQREEQERMGPAGRTFVVLGVRWTLDSSSAENIFDVPPLQANLAFAEAYLAEAAGARSGFNHRSFYRLYINDYVWFVLRSASLSLTEDEYSKLCELGLREHKFPQNLLSPETQPIPLEIFHRPRTFYSVMSHHTKDIARTLALSNRSAA